MIKYPHIRAIVLTVVLLVISGLLSFVFYDCCGAISAILASICAGCVTGIVFYVITNIRNNEIQSIKEEYEEADNNYQLAREIIHLCRDTIGNFPYPENNIKDICSSTKKLLIYIGTVCSDTPKTTRIINDYPTEYNKNVEQATDAIDILEKTENGYTKEQGSKALMNIMLFSEATKGILIKPWIQLMSQVDKFEKSKL